jgi:hypothetical protein
MYFCLQLDYIYSFAKSILAPSMPFIIDTFANQIFTIFNGTDCDLAAAYHLPL